MFDDDRDGRNDSPVKASPVKAPPVFVENGKRAVRTLERNI